MRRLSSVIVPIFKLMAFVLGVIGTGLAFLGLEEPNLTRVILFLIGCAVLTLHTRQWKSVYLQGAFLEVSGIQGTTTLPLAEIARVEIVNARRIRLRLRRRMAFGSQIIFVPRWLGHQTPEIARELAYRINHARAAGNRPVRHGPKPRPSSNSPIRRAA